MEVGNPSGVDYCHVVIPAPSLAYHLQLIYAILGEELPQWNFLLPVSGIIAYLHFGIGHDVPWVVAGLVRHCKLTIAVNSILNDAVLLSLWTNVEVVIVVHVKVGNKVVVVSIAVILARQWYCRQFHNGIFAS